MYNFRENNIRFRNVLFLNNNIIYYVFLNRDSPVDVHDYTCIHTRHVIIMTVVDNNILYAIID